MNSVRNGLNKQGYTADIKMNDRKTVHSALVKFRGLPWQLGLSGQKDEVLSIKIEVDTAPPAGAVLETSLVRKYMPLNIQHHDKASLLSGKLHAVLQRPYLKGRDFYDLIWYLGDARWPEPNYKMLNNALRQTDMQDESVTRENWRRIVRDKIEVLDVKDLVLDARRFLENPDEAALMTKENVLKLLEKS